MSYDTNPYYNPEVHGLTLVSEVELSEPSWSFNTLAVWRDDLGYYLGTDSGCSCPTPFENYHTKADLTGPLTAEQAREEAESIKKNSYEPGYNAEGFTNFLKEIN